MQDPRITKCLTAKRESKSVEFKENFLPTDAGDALEVLKDVVAIANSGGGTLVIGINNAGEAAGTDVKPVLNYDHAKYCDLIQKYTLQNFADFEVLEETKDGHQVAIFLINPPDYPLIFQKPGQYAIENNKQKTAFAQGTIFFRHGAKSEHGTSDDLRKFMQVRVRDMEEKILRGMRQVLEAPRAAQISMVPTVSASRTVPGAVPFFLTKNPTDQQVVAIDRGDICKYRQKEVLLALKERLPYGPTVTSHDIKAINKVYDIPSNELFCWQPDYSSKQYSDALVDWIVEQITNDIGFLDDVRAKLWNLEHP
jgi:schlafen family protein/restriction endonuclease-like protein